MYYEVYDKTCHLIQSLKKKYKNSNVWLQPSNCKKNFFNTKKVINGQYSVLRFDQKTKSTTEIKTVRASPLSIISYILEFFKLKKIDIRKIRTKTDNISTLEKCAPREYVISMYKENKALFYTMLKHTLPSVLV
jgi:hypothetical protein